MIDDKATENQENDWKSDWNILSGILLLCHMLHVNALFVCVTTCYSCHFIFEIRIFFRTWGGEFIFKL